MICSTIQSIDKALVARRFAHARNTYGREALVQQQVAEKMLRLLTKHACPSAAAPNKGHRQLKHSNTAKTATPMLASNRRVRKLCHIELPLIIACDLTSHYVTNETWCCQRVG